jgi:CRP-like cAMP-binding protein
MLLSWRRLAAIDAAAAAPVRQLALLRAVPFLSGLPTPTLERLAGSLQPLHVEAGTIIFNQGEEGDRFYLLADGKVDVVVDGNRLATFSDGYYFGEIALLHDVPRTATVTAVTDVDLETLERKEFLAAITGYPPSAWEADAVVATRLQELRTNLGSR